VAKRRSARRVKYAGLARQAEQLLQGTRLLSPLPVPQQIRGLPGLRAAFGQRDEDLGEDHGKPSGRFSDMYQRPSWYKGNRFRLCRPRP